MRAFLKNNRQAPRKVRLIARAVVGKDVTIALAELSMMPNKAAKTLKKVIESAVANASQKDVSLGKDTLKIENITVDKGITYMRYMPRAFGRATPVRRECSHILVTLASKTQTEGAPVSKKKSTEIKTEKKAKKTASDESLADKPTSAKATADKPPSDTSTTGKQEKAETDKKETTKTKEVISNKK